MSTKRQDKFKKYVEHESDSLWNYTLSPGWNQEEVYVLKQALQLFGIGRWKQIINSKCLPGKSIGQIYMQTQRLIGQQSLGEYMGLNIQLEKVFVDNMKKENVVRKNNCIINMGDNPNRIERKKRIAENKKKYGITQEIINQITLPKFSTELSKNCTNIDAIEQMADKITTIEMFNQLHHLRSIIQKKIQIIEQQQFDFDDTKSTVLNLKKDKNKLKNHKKQDITQYEFINVENFQDNKKIGQFPDSITLQKLSSNPKKLRIIDQNFLEPILE